MKKFIIYFAVIYLSLIFFMPKENLWFTAEYFLKKNSLIVSNEKIKDFGFLLDIKDGNLYFEDLKIAKIKDFKAFPYIFYNLFLLKNINTTKEVENIINLQIKNLKLYQSVIKPFKVFIKGEANVGEISGFLDIKKRALKLVLTPLASFKNKKSLLRFFKKTKEGFVYEYSFK